MARQRRQREPEQLRDKRSGQASDARSTAAIRVRRVPEENCWALVHPRCAQERQEDLEEVHRMIAAGEVEVARDELRWLLNGCSDFMEVHKLLGELALGEDDLPLARGHFGYAYRIGSLALEQAGSPTPVPFSRPANQALFESGKGLAYCLKRMEKTEMAAEVVRFLLRCDPTDPLNVKGLLE